jgi:hypothetical protein
MVEKETKITILLLKGHFEINSSKVGAYICDIGPLKKC